MSVDPDDVTPAGIRAAGGRIVAYVQTNAWSGQKAAGGCNTITGHFCFALTLFQPGLDIFGERATMKVSDQLGIGGLRVLLIAIVDHKIFSALCCWEIAYVESASLVSVLGERIVK